MISLFDEKFNSFDENNLKNFETHSEQNSYIQSLMPDITDIHSQVCPWCHAKNKFIKYGTYSRNISFVIDNNVENYNVKVQRIMCKSCKHTHALLPNFIVPYKIMSISSIALIVQRAVSTSVCKLAEAIGLSIQSIYAFIALVLAFFDDFKILNNSNESTPFKKFNKHYFLTNCIQLSKSNFRLDYFEFYNWFLFMQKFRNNPSPPIVISISKMPPT